MFAKEQIIEKTEMANACGGTQTTNNSDATYIDTFSLDGRYDIAIISIVDVVETTPQLDAVIPERNQKMISMSEISFFVLE
jgi:hypothetical protein